MSAPTPGNAAAVSNIGASPGTFAYTVAAGSNRVLYVQVFGWMDTNDITGITYAGVAMTRVVAPSFSSARDHAQIWKLNNPATGANNVVVTHTAANCVSRATARSFADCDQTANPTGVTATGSASNSTLVNVPTLYSDDIVMDCLGGDGTGTASTPTMIADTGRTSYTSANSGNEYQAASEDVSASNPESMNWSLPTSTTWSAAGIAVVGLGHLVLEQEAFRFRKDDGSETTATWHAAQDTNAAVGAGSVVRLRALVNATGDPTGKQFQIEYRKVGDPTWRKVPNA